MTGILCVCVKVCVRVCKHRQRDLWCKWLGLCVYTCVREWERERERDMTSIKMVNRASMHQTKFWGGWLEQQKKFDLFFANDNPNSKFLCKNNSPQKKTFTTWSPGGNPIKGILS